jgi:hypothetical protein
MVGIKMIYYKSKTGEVFAYEADGSQDAYIEPSLVRMTDAEVQAHLNPPLAPPSVPRSITMRQARLCLHKHGMLAGVQPVIDALPEPDRTAAQIEWEYSSVVERQGFVLPIAQALGISDEQMDALFIEAATL